MADGTWHNAATENYPSVVLGSTATRRLGIAAVGTGTVGIGVSLWP